MHVSLEEVNCFVCLTFNRCNRRTSFANAQNEAARNKSERLCTAVIFTRFIIGNILRERGRVKERARNAGLDRRGYRG